MSSTTLKTSPLLLSDFTSEQNRTIEAIKAGNKLLIAPKGYGKCAIGWTAAQELLDEGILRRVLVVAPLKVCELTWEQEHIVWKHLREPALALGDANARRQAIGSRNRIVVTNNENLAWVLNEYPGEFDGIVIDEISKFKSAGSVGVKRMRKHRRHFQWVLGMSATPVAESGVDIYSQAGIVCGFKPPFKRKETFLREYFYPTDWQQRNWALLPGAAERLAEALQQIVYIPETAHYINSLPDLREQVIRIPMPDLVKVAYKAMAEKMLYEGVEASNAGVVTGKLQQICQGFMYRVMGEPIYLHDVKSRKLHDILNDATSPVMIVYQFQYEMRNLKLIGIPILGDAPKEYERAWNQGHLPALAVHPLSAGHGINMQKGGHTIVQLAPIWSSDQDDQVLGRIWRRGQEHTVTRYTLVLEGSIDELMLDRLVDKQSTEGLLMSHLKQWANSV